MWPDIAGLTLQPENVETIELDMHGASSRRPQGEEVPPVDLSDDGVDKAAPAVSHVQTTEGLTARRSPRSLPGGIAAAIVLSAVVHAAAIVFFADRLVRQGVEAANEAVSVEIVLEAPPDSAPQPGAELDQDASEAEKITPKTIKHTTIAEKAKAPAETKADAAPPSLDIAGPDFSEDGGGPKQAEHETVRKASPSPPVGKAPAEPSRSKPEDSKARPAGPPVPERILSAQSPQTRKAVAPQPDADDAKPPQELAASEEEGRPSDPSAAPEMVVPTDRVPIPTFRPQPPSSVTEARPATNRKPEAARADKAAPRPGPTQQNAKKASDRPAAPAAHASTPSTRGGATAGEKAAYARRLANHVERYKRYPREAQRQGIHGTAGLSISIDRTGRLVGARLTRSSGAAILDREAVAVAGRAAPYPRPPRDIGQGTITFSVALRFSR